MALLKRKRTGLSDPMSVVTNFVNACNRHDAEGVSACLHPDFDSIQPMYPSRNFRGADQVRRNWQAIFDAEPGFRLTVLRSAAAGDTVWLELHGAGRDAEVAGVFVMGIQGDRIRWARIYSALVEGEPAATSDDASATPTPLREVPPLQDADTDAAAAAPAAVVAEAPPQEDAIAPVVDIDGNGRFRRRKSRRKDGGQAADPAVEEAAAALEVTSEAGTSEAGTSASAGDGDDDEPVAAADSIDPEHLVDDEPEPADVVPEATVEEVPGPDYELEDTMAVETIVVVTEADTDTKVDTDTDTDTDADADAEVLVETMVVAIEAPDEPPGTADDPDEPDDAKKGEEPA